MDEATFKALFPEFANTASAIVVRSIVAAEEEVDESVFGTTYDTAVAYLTAHILTRDPRGEPTAQTYGGNSAVIRQASIQKGTPTIRGTSRYLNEYERLRAAVITPILIA